MKTMWRPKPRSLSAPTPGASGSPRDYRALSLRTGRGMVKARVATLVAVAVVLPVLASMAGGYEARYALGLSALYAISILGGNIVTSTAGDVNLAIGAEMAFGAYGAAYGQSHHLSVLVSILLGVVAAMILAFVVSLGVVRLQGVYTALATFALAFCIPDLAVFFESITGGGTGTYVNPVRIGGFVIQGGSLFSDYVAMALFLVAGTIWLVILNGRAGRSVLMLGDAEPALKAFGRSSYWLKVAVWTAGGALAGVAGVVYGPVIGYLNPQEFTFFLSLYLFVGGIVGGASSVMGALIGGLVIGALPIYLGSAQGGMEDIIFGALLVLALVLGRSGVWPRVEGWATKQRVWTKGTPVNGSR